MSVQVGISSAELERTVRKFRALGELASKRQRKAVLRKGAKILEAAAKANVPIAAAPYEDGQGNTIAPGFVRDAVQIRNLRKSPDLFVGIEKMRGILAYWATWLEFGARNRDGSRREGFGFMRRALSTTKDAVIAQIISDTEKAFAKIVKQAQALR